MLETENTSIADPKTEGSKTESLKKENPPAKRLLEITPQTKYEVEDGFELPENILKGIREKDRVIQQQKERLSALEREIRERESAFSQSREQMEPPDPFEDPKSHADWLKKHLYQDLSKQIERRQDMRYNTMKELEVLHKLTGGNQEKIEKVIEHLKNRGYGFIQEDGNFYLQPGVIEDVYKAVFFEDFLASEKKKMQDELRAELEKARKAPYSPGQIYRDAGEKALGKMSPEERMKRLREDDVPFGGGKA